jgi:hypothetical protein
MNVMGDAVDRKREHTSGLFDAGAEAPAYLRSESKNNCKSWLGKFIHSHHPRRGKAAKWMGHPFVCAWFRKKPEQTTMKYRDSSLRSE